MSRNRNWCEYYQKRKGQPARETLQKALQLFKKEKFIGAAYDLGCGAGNDTKVLLKNGWKVIAVDASPESLKYILPLKIKYPENLSVQIKPFLEINWRKEDFVNASLSLPFCQKKYFNEVWRNVVNSIKKGGRFAGHFFGDREEWTLVRIPKVKILKMFKDFELEMFEEVEKDENSLSGEFKHFHYFKIVAKKKI
jgi:tellurite methyltransferase